jgi:hypothetical protein
MELIESGRKGRWLRLFAGLVAAAVGCGGEIAAEAQQGQGRINGQIYISPSGELDTPWVMLGKDVEIVLLRDDGTFDRKLKELREDRAKKISTQEQVIRKAHDRFVSAKPSEKTERASNLTRERMKLERLKAECRTEVDALIKKYRAASTRADGEGKFAFENLTTGRYFLQASFEILRTDQWYYWLLPVDLRDGAIAEVQLKKDNSVALYFD